MTTTRDAFIAYARTFSGSSSTGNQANQYLDLLSRGKESAQMRKDMGKMSSCALFVRALWWCFGLEHPLYDMPYRIGYAPVDVLTIAKDHGAYVPGQSLDSTHAPKPGDAFYVAINGTREHFGIFTKEVSTQPGTWVYETIEGGQGVGGQAIASLKRTLTKSNSTYGMIGDRNLIGWFDLDKLPISRIRYALLDDNPYK